MGAECGLPCVHFVERCEWIALFRFLRCEGGLSFMFLMNVLSDCLVLFFRMFGKIVLLYLMGCGWITLFYFVKCASRFAGFIL